MVRKRKPAAERKAEVLATALNLFAERGYEAVVMDEIARACGLARTTLYEYYASKEEILVGLVERVLSQAPSTVPAGATCRERLELVAVAQLTYLQQHRAVYRMLFERLPSLSGPTAERILQRRQEEFGQAAALVAEAVAAGELRPGVAPADAVFLFQGLVSQIGSGLLMTSSEVDIADDVHRLMALLWQGIGAF
jgi:AcrR family transcriptional regulator